MLEEFRKKQEHQRIKEMVFIKDKKQFMKTWIHIWNTSK
jgi:hypothetical protein